ncbi:MAG: type VI secretion system tip protein VgrG, partial [Burkholderiales bacterium]|nr:type VI secretion system tip protein VgrG [Burkholderiales bacterium]
MSSATDFLVSLLSNKKQRLLTLYFPNDDGPDAGLLINELQADEGLSQDFCYTVTALSDDPHIPLTAVQGRMACVALQREDGSQRFFNGYCFEFALLGVENSLATYQMVLRPWLAQFALRHNHRLFHQQNIQQQSKEIFLESGLASHEFRLHESDPVRTFSCQYDETDYNYLHRRWEEMGWCYWYEHSMQGHKLVLSDTTPYA